MNLEQLEQIAKEGIALAQDAQSLEQWRIQYLEGKKFYFLFNSLSKLSLQEEKRKEKSQ